MTDYKIKLADYYNKYGQEATVTEFGLTHETVSRYMRAIRRELREPSIVEPTEPDMPNILIVDIETSLMVAYTFGLWKQNIQPEQIIDDWFILGWAAKWLGSDTIYSEFVTTEEALDCDDKRIMFPLWELLEYADIVIAHNGAKFDVPRINTRMLLAGLKPPAPYQVLDTLFYYRKQFGFTSNKLDYLNKKLDIKQKVETGGIQLWKDCSSGSQKALDKMQKYNINDVKILEQNYIKVRPWIKNHPNVGVWAIDDVKKCTNCGSSNLEEISGTYSTPVNRYVVYRCKDCGAIAGRERSAIKSIKENKETIRSIAR